MTRRMRWPSRRPAPVDGRERLEGLRARSFIVRTRACRVGQRAGGDRRRAGRRH